jgi:hypothetical protein
VGYKVDGDVHDAVEKDEAVDKEILEGRIYLIFVTVYYPLLIY